MALSLNSLGCTQQSHENIGKESRGPDRGSNREVQSKGQTRYGLKKLAQLMQHSSF
jgi:hypothetical protein